MAASSKHKFEVVKADGETTTVEGTHLVERDGNRIAIFDGDDLVASFTAPQSVARSADG